MTLTQYTQKLIKAHFTKHLQPLQLAIDATCGNGADTVFLGSMGFKRILAVDIQEQAISNTKKALCETGYNKVEVIQDGHENILDHVDDAIDCVMFNLGYLPGADQKITTLAKSSIAAIESTMSLLSTHGLITIMCYPGHPNGKIETEAIRSYLQQLDDHWHSETHLASAPKPQAPILFTIKRKSSE